MGADLLSMVFLTPILKPGWGAFRPACPLAQQWVLRQSRWSVRPLDRQAHETRGVSNRTLSIYIF